MHARTSATFGLLVVIEAGMEVFGGVQQQLTRLKHDLGLAAALQPILWSHAWCQLKGWNPNTAWTIS